MSRRYETMFIAHPEVVGEQLDALVEKFQGIIAEQSGELVKTDVWGQRTLAYPIRKLTKGTYVILFYDAPPQLVSELERRLRIDEKILRFGTLRVDEKKLAAAVAALETASAAPEAEEEEEAAE